MDEYFIEQPEKKAFKLIMVLAGLAAVLILSTVAYYETKINKPANTESSEVNFVVDKGLSTRQIATKLSDRKIINGKLVFIIYSDLHGAGSKFQAGEYLLNRNMSIVQIVDVLTRGKVVGNNRNVTIIEGMTNSQIAKLLVNQGIASSASDLNKAMGQQGTESKFFEEEKKFAFQGFLFPDTYTLSKIDPVNDLVSKMLKNFQTKVTDKMVADASSQGHKFSEVLILASIIEKEVGRNKQNLTAADLATMQDERRKVASVFYNRLEIGMALESDATVNYITGKSTRSVSIDDTKIKSAFNTYLNKGLPPTPISNPGLNSIMAAIYPADTNYLYFLNAPDGTAYFAKTLAEHNANRAKYLK